MQEHGHLHFIVTVRGLDPQGRWIEADGDFHLPTPVLASKFRGKFLAYLREGFNTVSARVKDKSKDWALVAPGGMSMQQCINLLNKLGRIRWHADIGPAYEHAEGVYKYVGRYIRRGPISEKRIADYDGERVTIAYAHSDKHNQRIFQLKAEDFIGRILDHVPEKGTHIVRSYGLFHLNCRVKLNDARARLGQSEYEPLTNLPHAHELLQRMFPHWDGNCCPRCGTVIRTVSVYHRGQAPPLRLAA